MSDNAVSQQPNIPVTQQPNDPPWAVSGNPPMTAQTRNAKGKKGGFSARMPESLHAQLQSVANITHESLNAVIEEAFLHYVREYVGTKEFNQRADAHRAALVAATEQANQGGAIDSPGPRRMRSTQHHEATVPIAVRVDSSLEHQMRNVTLALGVTLNEVILESARLWVEYYPKSDQRYRQKVWQAYQNYLDDMARMAPISPDDIQRLARQMPKPEDIKPTDSSPVGP